MRVLLKSLLSIFILTGCVTTDPENVASEKWSDIPREENYPYSELEKLYDAALSGMTDSYFKEFPELDKDHTQALREYVRKTIPRDEFVNQMIRDDAVEIFQKARESREFRDTEEFKDLLNITVNVSVAMARMMMGGAIDIYVAKFVDKDPIKIKLFKIVKEDSQKEFIAWVYGEVSIEDAKKEASSFAFADGDKVYGFSSPQQTWENLTGRQGYLIVRKEEIIEVIVSMMN